MNCPYCGAENGRAELICQNCGADLALTCFACGAGHQLDDLFCSKCGQRLDKQALAPSKAPGQRSERKQVTVLFSDMAGYTAMTERLDPEEVKEVMSRIFGQISQVIAKYDGFIERFVGDAVMAVFGIPRVHEDDPVRAIRAGLEIHGLVEALSPQLASKVGRPLAMHSGINTGLVVTGEVNFDKGTHGLAGDVINLAARLQGLAGDSDILVGQSTYKLAQGHFAFEPLPPTKVKGKAEPVAVFKLLSAKAPGPHPTPNRQVSSVMVGRDREMDRLEFQVHKAINGQGSVVNVVGEAGIGKSRLMAELKRREVMQRVILLEGRAISIGKNLSFHPVIDLLKHWSRITDDDSEMQAFDKLERAIRAIHPTESDEILPFVATLMSLKLRGRHAERVRGIEGEALEKLILKNFRNLIIKGSELRPMVIVMEDLHWADNSSLDLLRSLYVLAEKHRLLFVNVFRPGYLEKEGAKTTAVAQERINLQPLAKQDSEALINNMLAIKGLPFSIKGQILTRAGGNPFFIEEVVRSLIDDGAVVRGAQGFEITDRIDQVVIPPTINEVLMARIDRLEEQTRELVKVASVIGRSFFDRILRDVAGSIGQIDARLSYLKDVQLIRERRRLQELEYLFSHALAQEAAYESTLLQERKALHMKVAQSIENIFQERLHEFYGMLAHHYGLADDVDKAEEYLTKAGEEALKSSASSEALNYLQEALRLYIDRHLDKADPDRLTELEKNIAIAFFNKSRWPDAMAYLEKVLYRWGMPTPKLDLAGISRSIWAMLVLAKALFIKLPNSKKIPSSQDIEALNLWLKAGEAAAFYDTTRMFLGIFIYFRNTSRFDINHIPRISIYWAIIAGAMQLSGLIPNRAIHRLLEMSQQYMMENDISNRMNNAMISSVIYNSQGLWGKITDFDEDLIDSSIRLGDFYDVATYLFFVGLVRGAQGHFGKYKKVIDKLLEIGDAYDNNHPRGVARLLTTERLLKMGRAPEAQIESERIFSNLQRVFGGQAIMFWGLRAESHQLLGDLDEALHCISQAEKIHQKARYIQPFWLAHFVATRFAIEIEQLELRINSHEASEVTHSRRSAYNAGKSALKNSRRYVLYRTKIYRLMGQYHWLIGKQGKALKWWDRAIKEGERLGARPDLSRTYLEVGKRLLEPASKYKQLNGAGAEGYLAKARSLFEEMGLQRDLDELDKITPMV